MSWQQNVGKYDGCFESTTQIWLAFKNASWTILNWIKLFRSLKIQSQHRLCGTVTWQNGRLNGKTAIRRGFGSEWPASSNWIYHHSSLEWDISWLNMLNNHRWSEKEIADWLHNREKPEHSKLRCLIFWIFVAMVPEGKAGVVRPCSSSIWQGFRLRFKIMWWGLSLWHLDVLLKLGEHKESRPVDCYVQAFLSGTLELSIIHKEDILFVQGTA